MKLKNTRFGILRMVGVRCIFNRPIYSPMSRLQS